MASATISVIVPTWNERDNIAPLLQGLEAALAGSDFEVVVVDDNSPDGTAEAVEAYAPGNERFRVVRRAGKLGLARAVLEGVRATRGDYVVMMDADLSHDPQVVPRLLQRLEEGYDVAVGSRYVAGGAASHWPWRRRLSSHVSILIARVLLGLRTRDLTSGFAAFRRRYLAELPTRYSARGFKLLLEVLAVWPRLRVAEEPITFGDRAMGESKYGLREVLRYLGLCLRLFLYRLRRRLRSRQLKDATPHPLPPER